MRGVLIASFFAAVLVAFAAVFMWKTTRIKSGYDAEHIVIDSSEFARSKEQISQDRSNIPEWLDVMAQAAKPLRLPADESEMGIDLVNPEFRDNTLLFLRVKSPDRFEKMCLERYFGSLDMNYTINDGEFYDILLGTKDPEAANDMIRELATYDLRAELIVRKEPKPY